MGASFSFTRTNSKLFLSREALRTTLTSSGILGADAYVVVAGPANAYAHYVTTREEYGVQRYEGASTIFGPCMFYFPSFRAELSEYPSDFTLFATQQFPDTDFFF